MSHQEEKLMKELDCCFLKNAIFMNIYKRTGICFPVSISEKSVKKFIQLIIIQVSLTQHGRKIVYT